jgi:4-hydroxy-3-polyprenylbenzoate decarboxylase
MAYPSLEQFVAELDRCGELIRLSQPVATELEITEIADREMKKRAGGKALLFEKPTIDGAVSRFPVSINLLGSERRMARALGLD